MIKCYSKIVEIILESFDKLRSFFHNSVCENGINAMKIVSSLFFQTYKLLVI